MSCRIQQIWPPIILLGSPIIWQLVQNAAKYSIWSFHLRRGIIKRTTFIRDDDSPTLYSMSQTYDWITETLYDEMIMHASAGLHRAMYSFVRGQQAATAHMRQSSSNKDHTDTTPTVPNPRDQARCLIVQGGAAGFEHRDWCQQS